MSREDSSGTLRVCMLVHENYFDDARVRRYAETLASQGVKVDIICISDADRSDQNAGENINVYTIPVDKDYQSRANFMLGYIHAFFLYLFKLTSLYLKHRYTLIHVHNMPDFLVFAAIVPRILGTPVILDIHDIMPEFYISKFGSHPDHILVKAIRLQERLSTLFASAVITVNRGCQDKLIRRGVPEKKLLVIYNTPNTAIFDHERFAKEREGIKQQFTLVFAGTQAPRYGLDLPIRALPMLIPKIGNIHLQIIGWQNDHTEELKQLAKDLNVAKYVEFVPAVPVNRIPEFLSSANIGIYPAIREPYMDTAVPEKVFEYTLMHLPIIATRMTVLEEMFTDKAILFFESGHVEQFVERVLEVYNQPELAMELSHQAGLEYNRGFSWAKSRKDYFDLLARLTGKRFDQCL